MSNFKVPVTIIREIKPHPNAERLEIATVYGFQVIIPKGRYEVGSVIIYAPVDSILPAKLEDRLFTGAKVKLHKGRIRQIRLRGLASQGMVIDPNDAMDLIAEYAKSQNMQRITIDPEQDLSVILGITKYDPNPPQENHPNAPKLRDKPKENPYFHKYNGVENIKWQPDFFAGEEVTVQEKLHGTNARYARLPTAKNTLWKKILGFFGLLPRYEFTFGSNNVQLQHKDYSKTGYYAENVYAKIAKQEDVSQKLPDGYTIYGEIIGPGIQKNYHYEVPEGQHRFVLFDVKVFDGANSKFLDPDDVRKFAIENGFLFVPELYRGPYDLEKIRELAKGDSVFAPSQKVREGVVIKSVKNYHDEYHGKKARKLINEDYLADQSNTDNH